MFLQKKELKQSFTFTGWFYLGNQEHIVLKSRLLPSPAQKNVKKSHPTKPVLSRDKLYMKNCYNQVTFVPQSSGMKRIPVDILPKKQIVIPFL